MYRQFKKRFSDCQTSPNPRKSHFHFLNVIKTFPMPPDRAWKKMKPLSSSSSSSEECRNWLELPRDVTVSILQRLGTIEILETAQKVCTLWRNISKDPSMWNSIDMRNLGDRDMDCDLEKMCNHAIDRSCGHLQDINIEHFGTDNLLAYITQSSSQLRRLRLVCCDSISEKALREAAAKLPLLDELGITLFLLPKESLEAVGHCCPLLKSLKWNQKWDAADKECDEEAVAIAKNMPELHHLQLIGNQLTNDGLQAILDGCPHLESLDLRRCFNVTLSGNLGRRCAERIKSLRHPNDSMDGYEFLAEQNLYLSNDSTDDYEFLDDIHDDDGSFDDDSDDIHDEDGSFGDDYEFVADIHDDDGSSDEESGHIEESDGIHDDDGSFDDDTDDIHDDDVSFDDDSDDIHDDDGSFDDDSNNIHDDDSDDESFDDDPNDDGSFDDDSDNNPIDSDDDDSFDDNPDDDESFDDDSDNNPIY
ncbi:F-box protein SKIP19-like [Castanea sativa]|uniref:F-box protein SKIP19-like n=1 Tax=Castanea sativa TaxID=21020 RepID=UPI003F64BA43